MKTGTKPEKGKLIKASVNTPAEGKAVVRVCAFLSIRNVAQEIDIF